MKTQYTLGRETSEDPFHVEVIKEKLTRNLGNILPDVMDEIQHAFNEYIPAEGDGLCRSRCMAFFSIRAKSAEFQVGSKSTPYQPWQISLLVLAIVYSWAFRTVSNDLSSQKSSN